MKPIEIKILMIRAGVTHVSIAKNLGVTDAFIHRVISGERSTYRVREAIAKAVGKRVEQLWPSCAKASEDRPNNKRKAA